MDSRIDQQFARGQLREALDDAERLLQRAQTAGGQAYPNAEYDLAMAHFDLARVLSRIGRSEKALPRLVEARQRFEALAQVRSDLAAERMASVCVAQRADCLLSLGRLDDAAVDYEEAIRVSERRGDDRQVAALKANLGTVRQQQHRYPQALAAYAEARDRFERLGEPGSVASIWHQTGMVYQRAGQFEAAEDAYRKSLAIDVRLGDVAGQAGTLGQLGTLYRILGHHEEAVVFHRQAADKYVAVQDMANEGRARINLANSLREFHRIDEARQEIRRAIEWDFDLLLLERRTNSSKSNRFHSSLIARPFNLSC